MRIVDYSPKPCDTRKNMVIISLNMQMDIDTSLQKYLFYRQTDTLPPTAPEHKKAMFAQVRAPRAENPPHLHKTAPLRLFVALACKE